MQARAGCLARLVARERGGMARYTVEDKKRIADGCKQWKYERWDDGWGDWQYRKTNRIICPKCKRDFPLDIMEVDHIFPQARRGTDRPTNLRLLCPPCNKKKGSKVERAGPKAARSTGTSKGTDARKKATSKLTAAGKALAIKKPTSRKATPSKRRTTAKRATTRKVPARKGKRTGTRK